MCVALLCLPQTGPSTGLGPWLTSQGSPEPLLTGARCHGGLEERGSAYPWGKHIIYSYLFLHLWNYRIGSVFQI